MKKRALLSVLFVLIVFMFTTLIGPCHHGTALHVDTPLKALVLYFPSPSIMRCLNHSDIPLKFHKASIYRKAIFPNKEEIVESVIVGVRQEKKQNKRFSFVGTITTKSEIIPIKVNGEIAFGIQNQKFSLGLFGLESLLGLQGKVHIKDKIGTQKVDYETYLKSTKGKIGDLNYRLELTGEDHIISDRLTYILTGSGMLGSYDILVNAKDIKKDNYEIIEKYGPVEIFTSVRVYD